MSKYRYELIRLVAADSRPTGKDVRDVLRGIGFRDIVQVKHFRELDEELSRQVAPDLLISDTNFPDGDVCELVRGIRHHEKGSDPFLPVIMLTWSPTGELVRAVIDAGSDNLLVKPLSTDYLMNGLEQLLERRKPFVVTSDYIGPDRRRKSRGDEDYPVIEVPNLLKVKAEGGQVTEELRQALAAAVAQVNDQKVEHHGFQVDHLTARIIVAYRDPTKLDSAAEYLEKLLWVAEDAGRRIGSTPLAHLSQLFESVFHVAYRLRDSHPDRMDKELKVLAELTAAIRVGVHESKTGDTKSVVRDIAKTVTEI